MPPFNLNGLLPSRFTISKRTVKIMHNETGARYCSFVLYALLHETEYRENDEIRAQKNSLEQFGCNSGVILRGNKARVVLETRKLS